MVQILHDVPDHRGFATTLASVARPEARVVLAFNVLTFDAPWEGLLCTTNPALGPDRC
jgi:hypothetical protein